MRKSISVDMLIESCWGGGCRPSSPKTLLWLASCDGLRPSNSLWIGFHHPACINQCRLVDLVSGWLMRAVCQNSINQSYRILCTFIRFSFIWTSLIFALAASKPRRYHSPKASFTTFLISPSVAAFAEATRCRSFNLAFFNFLGAMPNKCVRVLAIAEAKRLWRRKSKGKVKVNGKVKESEGKVEESEGKVKKSKRKVKDKWRTREGKVEEKWKWMEKWRTREGKVKEK